MILFLLSILWLPARCLLMKRIQTCQTPHLCELEQPMKAGRVVVKLQLSEKFFGEA